MAKRHDRSLKLIRRLLQEWAISGVLEPQLAEDMVKTWRALERGCLSKDAKAVHGAVARLSRLVLKAAGDE